MQKVRNVQHSYQWLQNSEKIRKFGTPLKNVPNCTEIQKKGKKKRILKKNIEIFNCWQSSLCGLLYYIITPFVVQLSIAGNIGLVMVLCVIEGWLALVITYQTKLWSLLKHKIACKGWYYATTGSLAHK